jgi:hypothetical protein
MSVGCTYASHLWLLDDRVSSDAQGRASFLTSVPQCVMTNYVSALKSMSVYHGNFFMWYRKNTSFHVLNLFKSWSNLATFTGKIPMGRFYGMSWRKLAGAYLSVSRGFSNCNQSQISTSPRNRDPVRKFP